jgi:hypothetical protein|nr:MAG TPA: Putative capsid protein [Caudoviricetes sp.]
MMTRDKQFYDIVAKGLASMGYVDKNGVSALQYYIQDMFASKYNAERTFANLGFPLNPNIPINPTYEQIEATIRPYTMATYVDIDSDGATKSTDGMSLKMGGLPTFKHEVTLSRKILREKMMLANAIGSTTPEIETTIMELLFNGLDDLLGGNYNTIAYQRHQVVSKKGVLNIGANNNPLGIPLTIDFEVPSKNKKVSKWYTKNPEGAITQDSKVGVSVDPISIMRETKRDSQQKDFAPQGHWEVSKTTWDDMLLMPYFRNMYVMYARPDITDADNRTAFGALVDDETIKSFIEARIGAPITVIDAISAVEKFNTTTKKVEYTNLQSFEEGVLVYVPDGAIGDVQCGKPIYMETPGARTALYDGGRTLIRQLFNDETMTQVIKSEVTGLCVPNKVRWMYYIDIKG